MRPRFPKVALSGLLAAAFIGCGGTPVETAADRVERKKDEWRRQRVKAEERFAEIAQRLPPSQRERVRRELEREFQSGERELERGTLR